MIKNERQYRITKSQAEKFEQALIQLLNSPADDNQLHPLLRKAQEDAIRSQLTELELQIKEYEALRDGQRRIFEAHSFEELPQALIQARIASGLSQKELAERLGMKEQQLQRYEATEYASASFERIQEIIQALGIRVREEIFMPNVPLSLEVIFKRLKNEFNLSKDFVMKRLIPRYITASLEQQEGKTGEAKDKVALQAASMISQMFGWSPGQLFGTDPLPLNPAIINAPRFKTPVGVNERRLSAYTFYAHYLALLVEATTTHLPKTVIPTDPQEVRKAILQDYGSLTFENVLRYMWDLGIPVIPLKDPGAFHGACWRIKGRNVIVLKQQTASTSRWTFDSLHELRHAGQDPEQSTFTILETSEDSPERRDSEEEQEASEFSGDIMLEGRSEELAELCVNAARGSVERLKTAVTRVASREKVPVDALANYLAYRLSLQGISWWGAANNLQTTDANCWRVARDFLLERLDFNRLNDMDRAIISQALSEVEV